MTQLPIDTQVKSIHDVFIDSQAFVVPEYQRSYQWEEAQVLGLIRDIYLSTYFVSNSTNLDHEIRFLGSIITIIKNKGVDGDQYGNLQPNLLHHIVDGQQRLTTFSLLAAVVLQKLRVEFEGITHAPYDDDIKKQIHTVFSRYEMQLISIYAYKRNQSSSDIYLPAIIRAENDRWDNHSGTFSSPVARILYRYIHNPDEANRSKDGVTKNVIIMHNLLHQIACGAFPKNNNDKDDAEEPYFYNLYDVVIRLRDKLWYGNYPTLESAVLRDSLHQQSPLLNFVRVLIFTHMFLHRCYVNHVSTKDERWAFDMFIGLNTSGIPLSAVETFRAYLLQKARALPKNLSHAVTNQIQQLFIDGTYGIEPYFDREKKATERAKRVKEYVTAFALYMDGKKVSYDLHDQRRYLKNLYDTYLHQISDYTEQQQKQLEFVQHMKLYTQYCVQHDLLMSQNTPVLQHLMQVDDSRRDGAMLALGFLNDANHIIVQPLLARFYEQVLRGKQGATHEFVEVCLAVTAFFALWRPIKGTNGLPDTYRKLMVDYISVQGENKQWNGTTVKQFLLDKLTAQTDNSSFNHTNRANWVAAATSMRAKRLKELTRFILLVVSHQTHQDMTINGLMKEAANGYQPYLTLGHWLSSDLKSIEHIAPQTPTEGWDKRLYDLQSNLVDSLGNLVLMPIDLNSSLQNNTWPMKWTYYQYLALGNADLRAQFVEEMKQKGITLQKSTVQLLNHATYAGHMNPIVAVGMDGKWDADLVQLRTQRMLEIFHDRMMQWLHVEE
jgi:hypothetical protein